jgi:hypothetical protein
MFPKFLVISTLISLSLAASIKKTSDVRVKKVVIAAPIDFSEISYKDGQGNLVF